MPRKWVLYTELFYPPFTEDVEELLARFQQSESVRFETFSAIWREMRFSDMYLGMPCVSEMKRFCRVSLCTAVKYFLPPFSYQIRVGGLYLMFGLYNTQLALPPVEIRMPLKDWSHVEKFMQDSINSGHYDVVYIYKKLVAAKAIHYTAMPHTLCFQKHRAPQREAICPEFIGRSTVIQDLLSADILEELGNIQNIYEKMKAATPEVHSKASMTHRDIVSTLKDHMSGFIVWQNKTFSQKKGKGRGEVKEVETKEVETEEHPSSRATLLSSIKQKSYSHAQETSKGRRHRAVQMVSECDTGAEDNQTLPTQKRKRPASLFKRTQKKLGVTQEKKLFNPWLLTVPESVAEDRSLPPMLFKS